MGAIGVMKLSAAAFALLGTVAAKSTPNATFTTYATKHNFAPLDILEGDDGLPPHPLQPLPYGNPVYPRTTSGDGLEMIEGHMNYFAGKYWMYSATWGCGGALFVYARMNNSYPLSPNYPPSDYGADGNCGIKTYSSPDLTNWTLEDFYQPSSAFANVTKPVVRYSNATGQYVMIMGGNGMKNFFYATAASPGGPWSNPPSVMGGEHMSHDFDVMVAPSGTHYIVTDPFTNLGGQIPTWDIYVMELAPNLTSTVGTASTTARIRTAEGLQAQGLYLQATSTFYHEGFYYLLFGMTCQNCAGYIYAYNSRSPLGPYTNLGAISVDGCGGQNKGASVLPTPDGGSVIVNSILGYRTGPTNIVRKGSYMDEYIPVNNYIWHADNHQAAASTYWYPLEFNGDHSIKNITCAAEVQIPLVGVEESPEAPAPYQLDCRVRSWQNIEATYTPAKTNVTTLEFPVWQRTDNLGPTTNAGPVLDGSLDVTLTYGDGMSEVFSWPPSNVSWAPAKIVMDVGGKSVEKIALSTNATNGCYGTLVKPKVDVGSGYGSFVPGLEKREVQGLAELYVHHW